MKDPLTLMKALAEIARSGKCDLQDRVATIEALLKKGYSAQANWLLENPLCYGEVISEEFTAWLRYCEQRQIPAHMEN
ncbi:hypothetical protein IQ235_01175 [Oscillatoriales cyanobacterium LEGE 11467]|uniref:Uncharacterized protein n=2 Tax=Zarconia TaxID=2992130 RepID=A0A928VVD3_9CYAN|nr:hypothetical protein [Zarconia navalis LEGE 11467]